MSASDKRRTPVGTAARSLTAAGDVIGSVGAAAGAPAPTDNDVRDGDFLGFLLAQHGVTVAELADASGLPAAAFAAILAGTAFDVRTWRAVARHFGLAARLPPPW